jgi:hypothetical protein
MLRSIIRRGSALGAAPARHSSAPRDRDLGQFRARDRDRQNVKDSRALALWLISDRFPFIDLALALALTKFSLNEWTDDTHWTNSSQKSG